MSIILLEQPLEDAVVANDRSVGARATPDDDVIRLETIQLQTHWEAEKRTTT